MHIQLSVPAAESLALTSAKDLHQIPAPDFTGSLSSRNGHTVIETAIHRKARCADFLLLIGAHLHARRTGRVQAAAIKK